MYHVGLERLGLKHEQGKYNGKTQWFKVPQVCPGKELMAAISGVGLEYREKVLNVNVEERNKLKA